MQTTVDPARPIEARDETELYGKLFAAETYVKVANMGVQIMGGYGLNAEFDMQRYFRDAKSATIAAGTSQTQRNLIASLMGLKTR